MKKFNKISLIGVGLLGGSIGMAVKEKKMAEKITGFFRNKNKIKRALRLKAIDEGTDDLKTAVEDADLIILCTPVADIMEKLTMLKKFLSPQTLITDIGSTKTDIIKAARGLNFIGSHPLAGSECSGIQYAKADMFKNSTTVLVLDPSCGGQQSLRQIRFFWERLGSKTMTLNAQAHDHLLAYSSHLPHASACALINSIPRQALACAAGGLKDTTRIALAETQMWIDIFLSNKKETLGAISAFEKNIVEFKKALYEENRKKLAVFLKKARSKRIVLSRQKNTGNRP